MSPHDFAGMTCSIARTLEIVGERWSLLILRDAFYGVRRFEDFQKDLRIARNILAGRLKTLTEKGILEKRPYEDRPPRYEYRLTDKGKELLPVLLSLMTWGDRWAAPEGPPVTITHTTCGHVLEARTVCAHCGEELRNRELRIDPLPAVVAEAR